MYNKYSRLTEIHRQQHPSQQREESTYVNLTKSISISFLIKILTSLILNP
jgi:hypothetical protein